MACRCGLRGMISLLRNQLTALEFQLLRPRRLSLKVVQYRGASLVVLTNEVIGWRLASRKQYEKNELSVLEQLIQQDDFCVDIGANIGIYSVLMAKKASEGSVVAFEPIPLPRAILELNAVINGLSNLKVYDNVVSDTLGVVKFSVTGDTAYSSMQLTGSAKHVMSLAVQSRTLDEMFTAEGRKVDIVKIDVEGAELLVLQGGQSLLSTRRLRPRALLVELNAHNQLAYGHQPRDVVEFMKSYGYEALSITASGAERGWPRPGCVENVLFVDRSAEKL